MGNENQVMERANKLGSIEDVFACISAELGKPRINRVLDMPILMINNLVLPLCGEAACSEDYFEQTIFYRSPQYDPR